MLKQLLVGRAAALGRSLRSVTAVAGALGAVACVTGGGPTGPSEPGTAVARFPDRGALHELSVHKAEPASFLPAVEVESWKIATLAPEPGSAYPEETSWDTMLLGSVSQHEQGPSGALGQVEPSPELRCAAQELARFYAEQGGFANTALQNYMAISCGSTLVNISASAAYVDAPEGVSDETLQGHLIGNVEQILRQTSVDLKVGMAYARASERAAVVAVAGQERAKLEGFSPFAKGVGVTLKGELDGNAEQLLGLINQGALGVRTCESDPTVLLPKFKVFCPYGTSDKTARVELAVRSPERVLYEPVAQALMRIDEQAELVYAPAVYGPSEHAADALAFRDALYVSLNAARKAARLQALAVERAQAEQNEQLAPVYFRALLGNDAQTRDQVALGLLAGWNVTGAIRNGGLWSGTMGGEYNAARFLAHTLDSPLGRWVLLEPSVSRVAIGVAPLSPGGVGAVMTTFALFDSMDHSAEVRQLVEQLKARRAVLGKAPPKVLEATPELAAALDLITKDKVSAHSGLSQTLNSLRYRQAAYRGWSAEAISLDHFRFPNELLVPDPLTIEIGVTHYQPAGAAWNQYAVLFVIYP